MQTRICQPWQSEHSGKMTVTGAVVFGGVDKKVKAWLPWLPTAMKYVYCRIFFQVNRNLQMNRTSWLVLSQWAGNGLKRNKRPAVSDFSLPLTKAPWKYTLFVRKYKAILNIILVYLVDLFPELEYAIKLSWLWKTRSQKLCQFCQIFVREIQSTALWVFLS